MTHPDPRKPHPPTSPREALPPLLQQPFPGRPNGAAPPPPQQPPPQMAPLMAGGVQILASTWETDDGTHVPALLYAFVERSGQPVRPIALIVDEEQAAGLAPSFADTVKTAIDVARTKNGRPERPEGPVHCHEEGCGLRLFGEQADKGWCVTHQPEEAAVVEETATAEIVAEGRGQAAADHLMGLLGVQGAEALSRALEVIAEQGGQIGFGYNEAGPEWVSSMEFGREAPDSPMAGGAAYGSGTHLANALAEMAADLG